MDPAYCPICVPAAGGIWFLPTRQVETARGHTLRLHRRQNEPSSPDRNDPDPAVGGAFFSRRRRTFGDAQLP
jgi:hypothetical protein